MWTFKQDASVTNTNFCLLCKIFEQKKNFKIIGATTHAVQITINHYDTIDLHCTIEMCIEIIVTQIRHIFVVTKNWEPNH